MFLAIDRLAELSDLISHRRNRHGKLGKAGECTDYDAKVHKSIRYFEYSTLSPLLALQKTIMYTCPYLATT